MTRVGLPEVGEVSYDGYVLDGAFHANMSVEHVSDQAGRTTMYSRYMLEVRAVIAAAGGSDAEMAEIHQKLSKQGRRLVFREKGFGQPLIVDATSASADVLYGPIPRITSWKPIGSSQACEVVWTCEFHLADCQGIFRNTGVLAANFTVSVDIDPVGDMTRTIAGHVLVVNRSIGASLTTDLDAFRTFIYSEVPLGFSRTHHYGFNEAKNRIDFTITDRQIPSQQNAFPALISLAQGRHGVQWGRHTAFQLRHRMGFELTPRADQSAEICWLAALTIFKKRLDHQKNVPGTEGGTAGVWLDHLDIEEDLWGRPVVVSFGWTQIHCLKDLIFDTGLFQPISDHDTWALWRTNMADWAHNARGNAKWRYMPSDDVVINVCGNQNGVNVNSDVAQPQLAAPSRAGFANELPPAERSYLQYNQQLIPVFRRSTVQQRILQDPDNQQGSIDPIDQKNPDFGQAGGIDSIVQQSSRASYEVVLAGSAKRVGYPIPKPKIETVGTAEATESGGFFSNAFRYNLMGIPVYGATWMLKYVLPKSPGETPPTKQPEQGINADGTACKPEIV